jgi:hypothetical protein
MSLLFSPLSSHWQASASDIVSLLAMTNDNEERECLKYYKTGSRQTMGTWGHEYVR